MHFLLLGNSSIVQRRVLPALIGLHITEIDVASRTRSGQVTAPDGITMRIFDDYERALTHSQAEIAYISTRNHEHATWAAQALRHGFHVIIDKPACLDLDTTKRLIDLAQRHNRCLAEATVYGYHPQIQTAHNAFTEAHSRPTQLTATFSLPPLAPDNFRYQPAFGGGALWDLGPYAITPGRLFFGAEPDHIICRITAWQEAVETAFSILATYSDGRSIVGHFGFTTGYQNRLEILGPQTTVAMDRSFTIPAGMENTLDVTQCNRATCVTIPAADSFALFLQDVLNTLPTCTYDALAQVMLSDAITLNRLRRASTQSAGDDTVSV